MIPPKNLTFRVIDQGREHTYDFSVTHQRIWSADLAYVVPAKWCRFQIDGTARAVFIDSEPIGTRADRPVYICRTDIRLFQALFRNRITPVTARIMEELTNSDRCVTRDALLQQKARLSKILPSGTIIQSSDDSEFVHTEVGYLFRRDLDRVMVMGANEGFADDECFQRLLTPPEKTVS